MGDFFRPHFDPARSIYDAFQAEAAKRNGREPEEWQRLEVLAVLAEANRQAILLGDHYKQITVNDVLNAQKQALGHSDYGAKWAYAVIEKMKR